MRRITAVLLPRDFSLRMIPAVARRAAFTVNSFDNADDGVCDASHCSLREAINTANALAGSDTIAFNIPGPAPHSIQPTSYLPTATDPAAIDGTTRMVSWTCLSGSRTTRLFAS